ncbi:bifunctional UDP-sugar hydrolase/5'-nucleotidase UshA [Vogesella sp. LIG4]|uniref:bifunctional UDP-sugar hydrolase/5'-nucleotidase UshA n=1 Tax=Vogesella sp. LIG4 TaxID=1192162 RepID=UPI000B5AC1D9|nr:bifunctional UDP-sugar hydrolase/5'-nucleotidase UshA [Vogesella sp. LIG4]
MTTRHTCISLALLALLSSLPAQAAPQRDHSYYLTIIHTNDHHGRFWKNGDGEYGMAARKSVIDQIRADVRIHGGYSLLLDGGDVNTGVPESDLQDAEPDFMGMNLLGYDAMAVGNHEFDKPPAVLARQRQWAKFPMLSANIYRHGKRMFAPYQLFRLGDLRVAVLGLTTDDTKKMTNPENTRDIEFRPPAAEAARLMPQLRRRADIIIGATHMGHYPDGKHGVSAPGDVEMARQVAGFNLIVGGHSQNPVCMKAENVRDDAYVPGSDCAPDRQNAAWIVQAHEWGKYVGRADFEYRNGAFRLLKYQLIPVNLKKTVRMADGSEQKVPYSREIPEDRTALALLQPYQDKGSAELSTAVGSSDGKLEGERSVVRKQATNLGVLIATTMQQRAHADLALMNAGGIRDSLPAGSISYRDILKVLPFGNTLVYVDMSGSELLAYLQAAARMTPGSGAFAQFAGVRLRIADGKVTEAQIAGQAIDPARRYRLALNSFTAVGGDGYPRLLGHSGYVNTGYVDADLLRGYFASHGTLHSADFAPGDAVVRQ